MRPHRVSLPYVLMLAMVTTADAFSVHPRALTHRRPSLVVVRGSGEKPLSETDPSLAALYAELGLTDEQRLEGDRDGPDEAEEDGEEAKAAARVSEESDTSGDERGDGAEKERIERFDRLAKGLKLKAQTKSQGAAKSTSMRAGLLKDAKTAESMRAALEYKGRKSQGSEGEEDNEDR